jgi:hypothetical protein
MIRFSSNRSVVDYQLGFSRKKSMLSKEESPQFTFPEDYSVILGQYIQGVSA